jgi:hypothetical protein
MCVVTFERDLMYYYINLKLKRKEGHFPALYVVNQ